MTGAKIALLLGRRRLVSLDSLVSHWTLDVASGTRFDSYGTNHLTDNNTVTQAAGKIGSAAEFTTANSESLTAATSTANGLRPAGSFTYSLWARPTGTTQRSVLGRSNGAADPLYCRLGLALLAILRDAGGYKQVTTANAPVVNDWNFVLVWYDAAAGTINARLNNGTVASLACGAPLDGDGTFRLGAAPLGSEYFDGRIDVASVWNRVLTDAEQVALYNGGNGLAYPFYG